MEMPVVRETVPEAGGKVRHTQKDADSGASESYTGRHEKRKLGSNVRAMSSEIRCKTARRKQEGKP